MNRQDLRSFVEAYSSEYQANVLHVKDRFPLIGMSRLFYLN